MTISTFIFTSNRKKSNNYLIFYWYGDLFPAYGENKMNLTHKYINNKQGKPEFIILPIAEYESLLVNAIPYDDDNEEDWEEIPVEKDEFDDVTIPNEVVWIMAEKNVNSLGAWRIYRNLSQQEVAEMAVLTQSAISQAERKESKPQKKTREKLAKIYNCLPEQLSI